MRPKTVCIRYKKFYDIKYMRFGTRIIGEQCKVLPTRMWPVHIVDIVGYHNPVVIKNLKSVTEAKRYIDRLLNKEIKTV
jgi:hypothetical protein